MESDKKNKIDRFLKDKNMSNAVYEVLHASFLKSKGQRDIQVLAAERLALDFLDLGWKELQKFQINKAETPETVDNVGL